MSWKSTKRRKSTAVLTSIAMLAATCAAILSLASPASAGLGANLYSITCDGNIAGTATGPIPTPVFVQSTTIAPDPALPQGASVSVTGDVSVTALGALQAGLLAAGFGGGGFGINAGSSLTIGATNTSTADINVPISTAPVPFQGRGFTLTATVGSSTITSADANFTGADVGAAFGTSALGALNGAFPLTATIGQVLSATEAVIFNGGAPAAATIGGTGAGALAFDFQIPIPGLNLGTFTTSGPNFSTMDFSVEGANFNLQLGLVTGTFSPCSVDASGASQIPGADDAPFGFADLIAPPSAPQCDNDNVSVGLGQTVTVDLAALCFDQNGDLDPTSFVVTPGSANGSVTVDAAGVATYQSIGDPGPGGDSFTFTVNDLALLGPSVPATISVNVLANLCDATAGNCSLTQIVTFGVVGAQKTMEQTGQFVRLGDGTFTEIAPGVFAPNPIVLNGVAQVAVGSLNDIEVLNARGDAAGWTVSAYSTDYGTVGSPTTPTPAGPVYDCSPDSGAIGGAGVADRLCIPGSNMGWAPSANVAHAAIPGDVATVTAGPASAADAAAWLTQLETGSNAGGLTGYLGGAPGAAPLGQTELCTAPVAQSGGTFACDAELFLGIPASAGAGEYNGAIILTLS